MKKRINWTISKDVLVILKQAQKLNGKKPSISDLVERAVKETYRNKAEYLREQAKELAKKLTKIQQQIKDLEDKK